ncbi:hypothetical protein [Haloarcula salinisoli]|uniref:Uncharacterized protein n=1 Tax=Haloarcula salinisoli TaxID=2487746 RepID=A0A8J7YFM2_9EURY|nr:hypothetical protein [Halomicroarcula salinisoli]MBX0302124.1 hypothetical protein [Halomicroarcula salinisoli]
MQGLTNTTTRQALLSVLLATLIVTSGCAGLLSGEGNTTETETATETSTSGPAQEDGEKRTNSTDLRSMSIPENGSVSAAGELDHGDPSDGNKYYEPVQVAAVEGQMVNITVEAESGNPGIRAVNPDGNITEIVSNEEGKKTGFYEATITQTGGYTFEVTSVDQNATFNYTMNIERVQIEDEEGLLEGDARTWNETEQYLFAAQSYGIVVNQYTDKGDVPYNVSKGNIAANATGDYAVITYEMPADYNFTQRNELDVAFQLSYEALLNQSRQGGNSVTNESWVPEIIFFKGVDNETGELVRTTFYTREWARQYVDGEIGNTESGGNYYSTEKWGPASTLYTVSGFETVTVDEFPQTYYNYTERLPGNTTLAERYGL